MDLAGISYQNFPVGNEGGVGGEGGEWGEGNSHISSQDFSDFCFCFFVQSNTHAGLCTYYENVFLCRVEKVHIGVFKH